MSIHQHGTLGGAFRRPGGLPNRSGQYFCGGPSKSKSVANGAVLVAKDLLPLSNTTSNAVKRKKPVVPSVSHLLRVCCPSAIAFAVALVVVYPVQGCVSWPFSHVAEEISVGMSPSIAYCDSTSTIVLEVDIVRIGASANHSSPHLVGFSGRLSVCCSVRGNLASEATTGKTSFLVEATCHDVPNNAAKTSAFPHEVPASLGCLTENSPSSDFLASQISRFRHCITLAINESPIKKQRASAGVAEFGCYPSPSLFPVLTETLLRVKA